MSDSNQETMTFLDKLGLLNIEGHQYKKTFKSGSALSSLYEKGDEQVVVKFLISPRNNIEVERFKLECSVLQKNLINCHPATQARSFDMFHGPLTSYPLPEIVIPLQEFLEGFIYFFGYKYRQGTLLSDLPTEGMSEDKKIELLHRIASGLNYFNRSGYIHRDLHPENILLLDGYSMDEREHGSVQNDPRVIILDMGNCQKEKPGDFFLQWIERDVDEDAVFQDNNRRLLTSFTSMPPDFLEKGKNTLNYDSWAFGVFAYKLLFNKLPCEPSDISDITTLQKGFSNDLEYKKNLMQLNCGLRLILNHLLSPKGENRPSIDSIVRLFRWLTKESDVRFTDENFVRRVIHSSGYDPDYDPRSEY